MGRAAALLALLLASVQADELVYDCKPTQFTASSTGMTVTAACTFLGKDDTFPNPACTLPDKTALKKSTDVVFQVDSADPQPTDCGHTVYYRKKSAEIHGAASTHTAEVAVIGNAFKVKLPVFMYKCKAALSGSGELVWNCESESDPDVKCSKEGHTPQVFLYKSAPLQQSMSGLDLSTADNDDRAILSDTYAVLCGGVHVARISFEKKDLAAYTIPGHILTCRSGVTECHGFKGYELAKLCSAHTCDAGFVNKAKNEDIRCDEGGCTTALCCDATEMCSTYTCGAGFEPKKEKDTAPCASGGCDDATCCDAAMEKMCSTHTCGTGFELKQDKDTT
eukprot:Rhum_TRINITY_DN14690_c0_g5::Rhum_TRINITY_DN14690_c0_g5_i1::g.102450::m.102450